MSEYHTPVLLKESVSALAIRKGGVYVDATFGGGGHSREILSRLEGNSKLIAYDRDPEALKNAPDDKRLILVHNNFRFLQNYIRLNGFDKVDGILADLGVSSHQFDTEERGFSFRFDAKLDMRMSRMSKISAEDIVNDYEEEQLTKIFREWGEVDNSRRVAKLICSEREKRRIVTTTDFNNVLDPVTPKFGGHKILAKIYQALRIEVNGEMKSLEGFLNDTLKVLAPGGRLVVITYHSLEDRMVKNFMKTGNTEGILNKDFYGNKETPFELITRKPVLPQEEEISSNTRARSAKLRVAEKKDIN